MDFYTVSYVESQITSGHTLGFVIFVVVLLALLGVVFKFCVMVLQAVVVI